MHHSDFPLLYSDVCCEATREVTDGQDVAIGYYEPYANESRLRNVMSRGVEANKNSLLMF
jgi:hypothetical protein